MDPYVIVKIGDNKEWTTKVVDDGGKRPNFKGQNTTFELNQFCADTIEFQVWDKEKFKADDLIATGTYHLPDLFKLKNMEFNSNVALTYKKEAAGQLEVVLQYEFSEVMKKDIG